MMAAGVAEAPEGLFKRIRLGQDSRLAMRKIAFADQEFGGSSVGGVADDLAAFANAHGGTLVLGVDEHSRKILGVPRRSLGEVHRVVAAACERAIHPPLAVSVRCVEVLDVEGASRWVVCIDVGRSPFLHKSPGGYLRRDPISARPIRPDMLARLVQGRSRVGLLGFDQTAVAGASFGDLVSSLVDRFRPERITNSPDVLARKLGLTKRCDDERVSPTVVGILLASEQPERWLPSAFIQAVAYRGTSVSDALSAANYQIDALDCLGPLDRQVADACRFVAKNQSVFASKSIGRADHPQYDMTAVFEAVVNAVAHRDYSVHGSKIRLRLFSDRLELYSPGGPPNGITLDALAYRQASRNKTVASLLARCPVPDGVPGLQTTRATLMDRRGEGVGVILRRSEEHSGRLPVYELFDESELRLTIFAAVPQEG